MHENGIVGNLIFIKTIDLPGQPFSKPDGTLAVFDLNDEVHFTAIYNKLYPYSFFFARTFVSPEDAADLVVSVFTKLWQQKKEFENLTHIKAFLRSCIKNACFDHIRNASSRIRRENAWYNQASIDEEGEEFFKEEIGAEKLDRIYAEMEKLPPRCRKVFKMAYLTNLKNNEIASLLGISAITVKNQKSHALKVLRMALLGAFIFLSIYNFRYW
ncbi:MAG: RNA polymerase sigma-70 factor [Ferruginibacter sp.]